MLVAFQSNGLRSLRRRFLFKYHPFPPRLETVVFEYADLPPLFPIFKINSEVEGKAFRLCFLIRFDWVAITLEILII